MLNPLWTLGVAAIPLLIWIYLLAARGGFWRVGACDAAGVPPLSASRSVVVVIPARNEAALIGVTLQSLARQRYHGRIHVIVVDDHSSDGTAAAARAAVPPALLSVIDAEPLPRGWTGKLWAQAQGVAAAAQLDADFLLFSDADIEHDPASIASLVAMAETHELDLVSHMVRLSTATAAERWLIPAFVFFFFMLYPPSWVNARRSAMAAAAGGCLLLRPLALRRIGGLDVIRSRIIDDCALARAIKDSGGRIWLGLGARTRSLRAYASCSEIGAMISRTAFAQLRHSYLLLSLTLLGLFVTYLLPVALLFSGRPLQIGLGAGALLLMSVCYYPMIRFYALSRWRCLCLPPIALFYLGAVLYSALSYARGMGGQWKGRVQDG